jgi:hypothetical protein
MSETGMALSNPYRPPEARTVACVGSPLPGVRARIARVVEGKEDLEPLVTVECPDPDLQVFFLSHHSYPHTMSHVQDQQWYTTNWQWTVKLIESWGKDIAKETHIEFNQKETKGRVLNKYKLTSIRNKVSHSIKILQV